MTNIQTDTQNTARDEVRNMVVALKMVAGIFQDDHICRQLVALSDEPKAIELFQNICRQLVALSDEPKAIELFHILDNLMNLDDPADIQDDIAESLHIIIGAQMAVEGISYEELIDQVDWRPMVRVYNTTTIGEQTYEVLRDPFKAAGMNDHSYMLVDLTSKGLLKPNVPITLRIVRRFDNEPDDVIDEQTMVVGRFGYGLMKDGAGHCTEICALLAVLNDPDVTFINKMVVGDKVFTFNKGDIYAAWASEIVEAMKANVGGVFEFHSADFDESVEAGMQRHKIIQVPIELEAGNTIH